VSSTSDFAYVNTTLAAGVANGSDIAFTNSIVGGGITYASPTLTIANAGKYQICFGFSVTVGGATNLTAFELRLNGATLGQTMRLGGQVAFQLCSACVILDIPAASTLQVRNVTGVARIITPPNTSFVSGGISSYLTIIRLGT
jgi:hypothetical protein